jgi:competence protein ComEC
MLALAAAGGYAALCGGQVPVRRALVMLASLALAALRVRPAARAHPLCAAALAVLAAQPEALFQAGAQLSFAATAALVLAPGRRAEPARLRALADGLRTSATAALATAPLAALRLGSVAPAGLAANLLAVPCTGLVLLPAALAAGAALAVAPEAASARLAARAAERVAAAGLAAVQAADARLPGSAPGRRPGTGALVAGVALAGLGLAARSGAARAAAAFGAGLALGFGPAAALEPSPPRVVFLDVGQGDATLVQGRSGALLVDAGRAFGALDRGRDAVLPALGALGVERLDVLAVTHADVDHRGGVPALLDALPVGELWLPFGAHADPAFAALRAAAARRRVPVRERGAGSGVARLGDLRVQPLWPPRARPAAAVGNEASLVLRVEAAGGRVLLAGDLGAAGEAELLASGADLRAGLVALPHHGSRGSSSAAFLAAVGGVAAVVSAPCAGRFGMPHPEAVRRARAAGYTLWWTGRDGAVLAALGPRPWLSGWGRPRCALPAQGPGLRGRFSRAWASISRRSRCSCCWYSQAWSGERWRPGSPCWRWWRATPRRRSFRPGSARRWPTRWRCRHCSASASPARDCSWPPSSPSAGSAPCCARWSAASAATSRAAPRTARSAASSACCAAAYWWRCSPTDWCGSTPGAW